MGSRRALWPRSLTPPLNNRDMVPPGFDNTPGFLGRHPTYRDLLASEVPEGRVQCHLAL
jgi:hypothetical protein